MSSALEKSEINYDLARLRSLQDVEPAKNNTILVQESVGTPESTQWNGDDYTPARACKIMTRSQGIAQEDSSDCEHLFVAHHGK